MKRLIPAALAVALAVALVAVGGPSADADHHPNAWAGHNPNHKPKPTTTTTTLPPTTTTTPPSDCVPGTPISVTAAVVLTGCYRSIDPAIPAVRVQTTQFVELDHARVEHAGHGVYMQQNGAQLNVHDSTFQKTAGPLGLNSNRAIYAWGAVRLDVVNNRMVDGDGVYWNDGTGQAVSGSFLRNEIVNVGRYQPTALVQALGLDQVTLGGLEVAWNKVTNTFGQSDVEDNIGVYLSNGTPTNRMRIHHNLIDGAYPTTAGFANYHGSGINTGDAGSGYVDATDNTTVSTTNIGLMISGGTGHELARNVAVNDACAVPETPCPAGMITGPWFGGGISVWNTTQGGNVARDNTVGWLRPTSATTTERADWYLPACAPDYTIYDTADNAACPNTAMPDPIDSTDEQAARDNWETTRAAAGVTTGPRPFEPEPGPIAGLGYIKTFEDTFDTLSPLWVEFPWFPPRGGISVENGSLMVRTEAFNPFPTGNEATTLGPRADTFPHYPEAKTWQGPGAYFQARFRYTNNPWTVPAFWLYSSGRANLYPNSDDWCPNTNPEWDIVEGNIASYGADRLSTMGLHKNTNSYCGIADEVQVNWTPDHGSGLSDWHTWSGHWTDCCLEQYLDGVLQTSMPHNGWLNDQLFLILHIDEGSTTPSGDPPKAWVYELEVSDVEVWQNPT